MRVPTARDEHSLKIFIDRKKRLIIYGEVVPIYSAMANQGWKYMY